MSRRMGAYGIMVLLLGMLLSSYRPAASVPDSPAPVPSELRQKAVKGKTPGKKLPDSRRDRIARATVTISLSTIFPVSDFISSEPGTGISTADAETLVPVMANGGRTPRF